MALGITLPRSSGSRRVTRWIVRSVLALVVLVVLLIALLHTPPARDWVFGRVVVWLRDRDVDLAATRIRYNLLAGSLSFDDLSVAAARTVPRRPFLSARSGSVDIGVMALMRGDLVIDNARLTDLRVDYEVDTAGVTNLPAQEATTAIDEPSEASPEPPVVVRDLVVDGLSARYADAEQDVEARLDAPTVSVGSTVLSAFHDIRMPAARADVRYQQRQVPVESIAVAGAVGTTRLDLTDLRVQALGSRVEIAGTVDDFSAPRLDFAVKGVLDTSRLIALADVDERVIGIVDLDARVQGTAEAPLVDLNVASDALAFRDLAPARVSLTTTADGGAQVASALSLFVEAPWAALSAEGQISAESTTPTQLSLRLDRVDTSVLSAVADAPYGVASRISGQGTVTMPGLEYLEADGRVTLTFDALPARPRQVPVAGTVDVSADAGRTNLMARLRALGAVLQADTTLAADHALSGTARIDAAVEELVPAVTRLTGGAPPEVTVAGQARADVRIAGSLETPAASLRLDAPALTVDVIENLAVSADAAYGNDVVTLQRLRAVWQDGELEAAGRVALDGVQAVEGHLTARNLDITVMTGAVMASPPSVAGIVSAEAEVRGTVSRPTATARITVNDLMAYGEPLGTLDANVALADQVVNLSRLRLDKPQAGNDGWLEASGTYAIDTNAADAQVRSDNLRVEQLRLDDGTAVTGGIELAASVRGAIDDSEGHATFAIRDLRLNTDEFGDVEATVSVADRVARFDVQAPRFAVAADGTVSTGAPYTAQARVQVNGLDLARVPVEVLEPLTGTLRATAVFDGPADDPLTGSGSVTIDSLDAAWQGQPLTTDGPAEIRYADRLVSIERLAITARDSRAEVSGRMPVDADAAEPVDVRLDASLALGSLATYAPPEEALSADGTLLVEAHVGGTPTALDPSGSVKLDRGFVLSPRLDVPIANLHIDASVADGRATLAAFDFDWGTARFTASGAAPIAVSDDWPIRPSLSAEPSTLKAQLANFNPAAVPGAPEGLGGLIGFTLEAQAATPTLESLDARLRFDALTVSYDTLELQQSAPSAIVVRDAVVAVESLELAGSAGTVNVAGSAELAGTRTVDAAVTGNINLGIAQMLSRAVRAEGPARFDMRAAGTLDSPTVNGFAEVADVSVIVDEPRVAVEDLRARVDLADRTATLSGVGGSVNGGTLQGGGHITLGDEGIADADLTLSVDDLAFSAPLDLRSLSDVRLRVRPDRGNILVEGDVTIAEAGLTGDINFDTGILAAIGRPRGLDLTAERSPLVEQVHLNVAVTTETPVVVNNNLAKAEITTDLRVVGTPYDMGLTGQMEVLEGSSVTLNERRYEVERGLITFLDETRIVPSFDLRLTTRARQVDVTLGVTGEVGETDLLLTSDPALPEPDIMALLVTGRTLDEMRGEEYDVAREQVTSYLTGRAGSALGRGLQRATGLSEVRVEPTLIAGEAESVARLTVGQDLTDQVRLVYSTALTDSRRQLWMAEYDITRRFRTRLLRQDANTYRLDFRHELRFGGPPEPRRVSRVRPPLASLTIETGAGYTEAAARDRLKLREGTPYDFFRFREGVERIERDLREQGYLQSRVRASQESTSEAGNAVRASVRIDPGPRVRLVFEGADPPRRVREDVATRWQRGIFDTQRAEDGSNALVEWLVATRHLDARVSHSIEDGADGSRLVRFFVEPGSRFERVLLSFDGAAGISSDELASLVREQNLEQDLITDPVVVTELLRRYYREEGYLAASLETPRPVFDGSTARIVVPVDEGPRFIVRKLDVAGNEALTGDAILAEAPLLIGDPFLPIVAERSLDRIRQMYWRLGYNDVRLSYDVDANRNTGETDVTISVREGRKSVVARVDVNGTERTSEPFVRREVELNEGETLDLAAVGRSRRSLYQTGAYSSVEILRETAEGGPASPADAPAETMEPFLLDAPAPESPERAQQEATPTPAPEDVTGSGTRPVETRVNLREVPPFQVSYGLSFDTDGGLGGLIDASNHNSLGRARVLGMSARYDGRRRQARLYVSQPMLRQMPLQTLASLYARQERTPETATSAEFVVDRYGASIQQERKLGNSYVWNYGLSYEQARTFDPNRIGGLDETVTVTPLTSTFTREMRDDILDATRGSFTAHAFTYSPEWLGSDQAFVRYYGQFFRYFALEPERRERLTHEILRPRFVFAVGARLGLMRGIGGEVPRTERFFAGGGTTLRGFGEGSLGPRDQFGIPTGGNATLVLNAELRFPLLKMLDGVGFVDIGGVSGTLRDWSVSDIRETVGLGIRVRTPWFLLRGDYGFVLDGRPGEPRGRFFFSLGQAF